MYAGTGYSLMLSKGEHFNTAAVTKIVETALPRAALQKDTDNYAVFKLPVQQKNLFPRLFRTLEASRASLHITGIEVEYSTMDQLFMKWVSRLGSLGWGH